MVSIESHRNWSVEGSVPVCSLTFIFGEGGGVDGEAGDGACW